MTMVRVDPCKVALYIRWSTDDQSDGTTLEVQTEGCRHYVMSQGWTVADHLTFIDDGQSGATLSRPALTKLRDAVARSEVDCVVVYKLDRLSRNVLDLLRLILEEWEGVCTVRSAREPVDTDTQAGKMFFYTLASFAEWERSVIRDRTFSGKLRRVQEGKNPGFKPAYGYARGVEPGSFRVVPEEAEVVRRIYQLYLNGMGARRIVEALHADGLRFREGRPWTFTTVMAMIENPAYKGDLVYGRRRLDAKRKSRPRNGTPHLALTGVLPAIIDNEVWQQVQRVRDSRPSPKKGESGRSLGSDHLLTGMARCGGCGAAITAQRGTRRTREGYYFYYTCKGVGERGRASCQARTLRQEVVDGVVVDHLKELYSTLIGERSTVLVTQPAPDTGRALRISLEEVDGQLKRMEARRRQLRHMVLEQQVTMEEYRLFVQDLEGEASTLDLRRKHLVQSITHLEAAHADQARLLDLLRKVNGWDQLLRSEQKALIRAFVDRIEIYCPLGGQELQCDMTWRISVAKQQVSVTLPVQSYRRAAPTGPSSV